MNGIAPLHPGLGMIALAALHRSVSTTAALTLATISARSANKIPAPRHRAAHVRTPAKPRRLQHHSKISAKTAAVPKAPALFHRPPPPKAASNTMAASACPS